MSHLPLDSDSILCAHLLAIDVLLTLHASLLVIHVYDPNILCVSHTQFGSYTEFCTFCAHLLTVEFSLISNQLSLVIRQKYPST